MPKSGLLEKEAIRRQTLIDATQLTIQQLMMDTAQVILHRDFGWGYDRIKKFTDAWAEYFDEIFAAVQRPKSFLEDDRDIYRETLDNALKDFLDGHKELIPFMERYPYAKEVTYDRKSFKRR